MRYVKSRAQRIAARIDRGGRLTRAERMELFATGRMLDSVAAQVEMLYDDDVFAAAIDGDTQKVLRECKQDLRDIAREVLARAEQ